MKIRQNIENHLGIAMVFGLVLGLAIPGLQRVPAHVVIALLSLLIFIACFRIDLTKLRALSIVQVAKFYVIRFCLVPAVVFFVASAVAPQFAPGVLLLALVPAGVSAPALSGIVGGSVALTLAILLFSSLLTPFILPPLMASLAGTSISVSGFALFYTLAETVLIPIGLFGALHKNGRIRTHLDEYARAYSIVLVSLLLTLAIGARRDIILANPFALIGHFAVSSLCFFIFFVVGWLLFWGRGREWKIGGAISSGCNNASLALSIALLHLPESVTVFLVVAEIPWMLGPVIFGRYLRLNRSRATCVGAT